MTLQELIKSVKEENLPKEKLENYRDDLSNLFAEMQLELATIEKYEAMFMNTKTDEQSVAETKIKWKATEKGQREIMLKRYCLATKELLNSLKSRLYSIY